MSSYRCSNARHQGVPVRSCFVSHVKDGDISGRQAAPKSGCGTDRDFEREEPFACLERHQLRQVDYRIEDIVAVQLSPVLHLAQILDEEAVANMGKACVDVTSKGYARLAVTIRSLL